MTQALEAADLGRQGHQKNGPEEGPRNTKADSMSRRWRSIAIGGGSDEARCDLRGGTLLGDRSMCNEYARKLPMSQVIKH